MCAHTHRCVASVGCVGCVGFVECIGCVGCLRTPTHPPTHRQFPFPHTCDPASIAGIRLVWPFPSACPTAHIERILDVSVTPPTPPAVAPCAPAPAPPSCTTRSGHSLGPAKPIKDEKSSTIRVWRGKSGHNAPGGGNRAFCPVTT